MQKGVLVLVFLLVLCVLVFIGVKQVKHPVTCSLDYKDYVAVIASLTSIFVALAFILEYCQIQKTEKEERLLAFADDSRDYWEHMEKRFEDPDLFDLYTQIHSNHPDLQQQDPSLQVSGTNTNSGSENPSTSTSSSKKIKEIQAVSMLLRQIESMFIVHGGLQGIRSRPNDLRREQQLRVWKRWFERSPILRYHYAFLKENLGQDTNEFIRLYLLSGNANTK